MVCGVFLSRAHQPVKQFDQDSVRQLESALDAGEAYALTVDLTPGRGTSYDWVAEGQSQYEGVYDLRACLRSVLGLTP